MAGSAIPGLTDRKFAKSFIARGVVLTLLALLCCNIILGDNPAVDTAHRDKARYFFIKGALKEAQGHEDEAYEFFRKAYQIDTTYADAAFSYGYARFFMNHDTLGTATEQDRALRMARKIVDLYPGDSYNALSYAYMAMLAGDFEEALRVYRNLECHNPSESATQMHKAQAFSVMHLTDSAINAVRNYERIEGVTLETTLEKFRYYLADNDTASAINELTMLIDRNPTRADFVLTKGKLMQLLQMPDSALNYFKMAETLDPEDGRAKNELAAIYAEMGDSTAYDNYTYMALMSDNLDLEVKLNILQKYLQKIFDDKSDTKRSDDLFEKLAVQFPHEPKILSLEARYSAAKHDFPAAIEQIKYALDLDNSNTEYFNALLSYYLANDDYGNVIAAYENEIANDSVKFFNGDLETATILYINANDNLGNLDKALDSFDSLIKSVAPQLSINDSTVNLDALRQTDFYDLIKLSDFYQMAGDLMYKNGQLDKTFTLYDNALEIFPDNQMALNNYAYFLVEKGGAQPGSVEFEKAKTMSKKALELSEKYPSSTYIDTYAWILFKEKDFDEAEKYQREAVEIAIGENNESGELYSHLGDILFMNNKPEEAVEMWEKALELEPDDKLIQKKVKYKTFFYE